MPFLMVRNDITKIHADAIVNPANNHLLKGSGTSEAIYQAAGEELLTQACLEIGYCELGKAVITKAFGLNASYVIHAVGPGWKGGFCHEKKHLYSAYTESLKLAKQYQCESIAFPLLSSGNYGYPKDKAVKVAISAISDFLLDHEMLIYLVLYDSDSLSISKKLFASIEEFIDDNYVEKKNEFIREEAVCYQRCECPESYLIGEEEKLVQSRQLRIPDFLLQKRTLESLVKNLDESFSQMLLRLIDERGLKDSDVYRRANVDRRHFSKIRNDKDYVPTKKTVIAFIIALELTMDEAIDLLKKAGFAFSNSSKFDVIIRFFIENKSYDIFEINEVLFTYEQPILGE